MLIDKAQFIAVKKGLNDDHDNENDIDKNLDEARGAKLKYN